MSPNPSTGQVDTIWGRKVVSNKKIPIGTALVFDTSQAVLAWTRKALSIDLNRYGDDAWSHNYVVYRAEQRVAVGIPRPKAINIVTGIVEAGS